MHYICQMALKTWTHMDTMHTKITVSKYHNFHPNSWCNLKRIIVHNLWAPLPPLPCHLSLWWLRHGCVLSCISLYISAKMGTCPPPVDDRSDCSSECSVDHDCDGNLKCCQQSCGRICAEPDMKGMLIFTLINIVFHYCIKKQTISP